MREIQAARLTEPGLGPQYRELYRHYRAAANRRGYSFLITFEEFKTLILRNCYYCGQEPNMSYKGTRLKIKDVSMFKINGIDRVNNDEGYILSNCVTACKICNNAKNTLSSEEFLLWINKIYTYRANSTLDDPSSISARP